jgi:rhodanese-related sulfurtransferase
MYRSFFFIVLFSLGVFSQAPKISQDSLKSLMTNGSPYDFLLIDVRGESELTSMIGNSKCKPYNLAWPEQLQAECGKIGKDQVVILYCRSGNRAQNAANYLDSLNFTHVYNAGGIITWNGPTVTKTDALPVDSLPKPSMKGTITFVTCKAETHQIKTVEIKTTIPYTFSGLYIKKGPVLFQINGSIMKKGTER